MKKVIYWIVGSTLCVLGSLAVFGIVHAVESLSTTSKTSLMTSQPKIQASFNNPLQTAGAIPSSVIKSAADVPDDINSNEGSSNNHSMNNDPNEGSVYDEMDDDSNRFIVSS